MNKIAVQFVGLLIYIVYILVIESHVQKRMIIGPNCMPNSASTDPACDTTNYTAIPGQLPWHVIIKEDHFDYLKCGGSIISESWVLTAAHCCYRLDDEHFRKTNIRRMTKKLKSLFLVFGSVDLNNETALNMTSTELYVHPEYEPITETEFSDVALIKLPKRLQFTETIATIRLPRLSDVSNNFVNYTARIGGFGMMSDEYLDVSEKLIFGQVRIIDNSVCAMSYTTGQIVNSTICAVGYDNDYISVCTGDSGGAMVVRDENGDWMQIGVNSFVRMDQCTERFPSAYARVTEFLDFIVNVTGVQRQ